MLNSIWLCVLVGTCSALYLNTQTKNRNLLLLEQQGEGDDADIKIASGHFGQFTQSRAAEDAAELAAQEFLRQKNSGNIDHARDLGKRFAAALLDVENGPLAGELGGTPLQVHHQYLLYTYVINRVIAEHSPDSILAQTSLNVFYSEIEQQSADLHQHISDMAAFSLYILCERSQNRSDDEIGRIFAQLCGRENDPETIEYGNCLYRKMYAFCAREVANTPYSAV